MCGSTGRPPPTRDIAAPPALAGPERRQEVAARGIVQCSQIDRGVAFVAEDFDERRPSLFGWRKQLAISYTKQVHLKRLGEKVFCVSAVRTRKRQRISS